MRRFCLSFNCRKQCKVDELDSDHEMNDALELKGTTLMHLRHTFCFAAPMLIAALAVVASVPRPGRAQSSPELVRNAFVPANDVSFTISVEKNTFGVREKIPVKYRIENISNSSLYAPRGFEVTACLDIGPPHISGGFENNAGKHYEPGYGSSCSGTPGVFPTLTERMSKGTILLRAGEHFDGILQLDPQISGGLAPGPYRIEVVLRGWKGDDFTDAQLTELARMGSPFLRGEVPASARITLTP
jgi:hypothetical protein